MMWTNLQKILGANEEVAKPPSVPLRKQQFSSADVAVGKVIRFATRCPLAPLSAADAVVIAARQYRFGADVMKSYQLQVGEATHYYLTIAQDDQGEYLGISRLLNEAEQETWFGRDALGFFTEASTAKSIRCKADLQHEGEWVEGSIAPVESPRLARTIHYSLLVNEVADKALEIEHEDSSGENRFFITVYRPIEDIASVDVPEPVAPVPAPVSVPMPPKTVAANDDVPLFREPAFTSPPAQPKQRMDFRRIEETSVQIHIERTPPSLNASDDEPTDLPAFLLNREGNYLSLDHVIPPEAERVRVGIGAAQGLIEVALRKNVRVRDVLRDMLGLESAMADEVIFELPLTDEDYRTLAMRYKLRPDHRVEIRSRLEEELRKKLTNVAKA
jgi:hypothetical protein